MPEHRDELIGAHSSSETSSSVVVPDHELVRLIGRGSYGEVWLSRSALGSYRAVKIVFEKTFRHKRPFEREFNGVSKFEPLSRLHEGLMDVLQVGRNEAGGYFYCVMELADDVVTGQTIDPDRYFPRTLASDLSRRKRLPVEECRRIGTAIASALDFLHGHSLIHRDVKPSNIVFVNGIPKLADIGLVVEMSEARSYVGTEGFIPPEGPGTPQADIYSLGKVLYEISTGKDRHDYPELPTLQGEGAEDAEILEFNRVILKTCRSDPRERCQSAREMVDELAALQNGGTPRRRFSARRKWMRWLAPGIPVLLALCLGGWFWFQRHNEPQLLTRVVPNYLETSEVPYGSGLLKQRSRYQLVYGAEEFPSGPILIKELRFRPDAFWGHAFSTTVSNLQVRLSTTSKKYDQLSATLAENTGGDEALVFKGALKISSRFAGPVGGPKAFDIVIPLQTPFLYDRDAGNLLLDVLNLSGSEAAQVGGVEPYDSVGKDRGSRAVTTNALSPTASFVNSGVDALQICYQTANVRVACWSAEGSAEDRQGGNHGTIREVTFVPGKIGQAFRFSNSNSLVRVPNAAAFQFAGPFSVTAWAKYSRTIGGAGSTIIVKGSDADQPADWQLTISAQQRLNPHVNLNGDWHWFNCKTKLEPGIWYHVAMTFDGTRLKGFVNGVVDGEQGAPGTVRISESSVKIGRGAPEEAVDRASGFGGDIDEVSVYKGALSEDEIRALYEKDLAAKPPSPGAAAVR